jgi:hypothetical protein
VKVEVEINEPLCNPYINKLSSRALIKVNEDKVASSWKDSYQAADRSISEYLSFQKGLLYRQRKKAIIDREYTINKIWSLVETQDGNFSRFIDKFF